MSLWGFVLPVYRKRQLRNWMFLEGYILLANMDWFWFSLDFESRSSLPGALWASPVLILYKFHCYSWVDRKPSCALMEVRTKGWVLIKHEKIKSQGRNPERARLLVLLQVEQALSSSQSVTTFSNLHKLPQTSKYFYLDKSHRNTEAGHASMQLFEERLWWLHWCCMCQIS